MKNSRWIVLAAATVLLAACAGEATKPTSRNRFGSGASRPPTHVEQDNQFVAEPTPSPSPPPTDQPTTSSQAQPSPSPVTAGSSSDRPVSQSAPTTASRQEIPYATPVPGKSGLVTSPYAPYAGYVDVRGYPPGQEVKCPYTGKLFRVP